MSEIAVGDWFRFMLRPAWGDGSYFVCTVLRIKHPESEQAQLVMSSSEAAGCYAEWGSSYRVGITFEMRRSHLKNYLLNPYSGWTRLSPIEVLARID